MSGQWMRLWQERRPADQSRELASLLAAGGYESGFAGFDEDAWRASVGRRATELGIGIDDSVFEVGCGAGAFLHELRALGCRVGGLDPSPGLIELASAAIPDGAFRVAEATDVGSRDGADAVISCGAFLYFPTLEYASAVIGKMVGAAVRSVGIYDLPDAATAADDLARRQRLAGGAEAYRQRYEGLDHRYYERDWVATQLTAAGLVDVQLAGQDLAGYGNAPFRFNAWGRIPQ